MTEDLCNPHGPEDVADENRLASPEAEQGHGEGAGGGKGELRVGMESLQPLGE